MRYFFILTIINSRRIDVKLIYQLRVKSNFYVIEICLTIKSQLIMRNFKILSLIVVCMLVLQSCSEDENMELVEFASDSIELRTNKLSYNPGETMRFKIISSEGEDFTSLSSIFVNGVLIRGKSYTVPSVGTKLEIHAEFNGVKSNVYDARIFHQATGGGCG